MRFVPPVSTVTAAALLAACGASARDEPVASAAAGVKLVSVGTFQDPLYITSPPRDTRRIMVVEQGGTIWVVKGGKRLGTPFLDISGRVTNGGEQGLLGLAFAPDYATSGLFYVYYTARPSGANTLVEYRAATPDRADPGSARTLFSLPDDESNHNGGQLAFGPDGLLYIGLGDGGGGNDQHGSRGNAQNLGSLFGKILRIDPHASGGRPYTVPPSNPFVGRAGARGEVYSYGLRNPWRFSFDRATGALSIGDVGQNAVEEVDAVRRGGGRGANFGWRPWEGRRRLFDESAPGAIFPVIQKTHDAGWCSVTGGYVVRDPGVPALRGRYVYGDFCQGVLRSARLRPGGARGDRAIAGVPNVDQLSSFGEDARGRVYVVSLSGPVYRLASR
jgi:glucose/arabinose dehydrogenase